GEAQRRQRCEHRQYLAHQISPCDDKTAYQNGSRGEAREAGSGSQFCGGVGVFRLDDAKGSLASQLQAALILASRIASQTFIGEIGVWIEVMPRSESASITPLAMQGGPPIAPDSPQPLAPNGLVRHGAEPSSVTSIGGTSSARGMQ